MSCVDDLLLDVYCFVDDWLRALLGNRRLRARGKTPKLSDAEVLTIEIVGQWLGHTTDVDLWTHADNHWRDEFPQLGHRTTFARQAANLVDLKRRLWRHLIQQLNADQGDFYIVDGFPMISCSFKRLPMARRFLMEGQLGYCPSKSLKYFGFKGHVLIHVTGVIVGCVVTGASGSEREACEEMLGWGGSVVLGDKGYIGQDWQRQVHERGHTVITPLRKGKKRGMKRVLRPIEKWLLAKFRKRVETVIGQLEDRFGLERVRVMDRWHLQGRVARALMAHTMGIFFNQQAERPLMQLRNLIPA